MEFHELLENEKFKAAIGPEKLASYLVPDGTDAMWEDFERESENVLTLFSVHSSPIDFSRWHGFYVWQWSDTGESSVSDDLVSFFGKYPFENLSACEARLQSKELSNETLKRIALSLLPDEGDEIRINASLFRRDDGDLALVTA